MTGQAQTPHSSDKLYKKIAAGLKGDFKWLSDSISFLGFTIEVQFKPQHGSPKVSAVIIKDSVAIGFLDNYDFIKSLDFSSIVGREMESSVFIPVVLLRFRLDEEASLSKLPIREFNKNISGLFDNQARENGFSDRKYFTKPFIIYEDKTIFN